MTIEELREQMVDLISEYSEGHWAAGWMSGIEDEIRRAGGVWLVMAGVCGGWPQGYRGDAGWEPLNDAERAELAAMLPALPPRSSHG